MYSPEQPVKADDLDAGRLRGPNDLLPPGSRDLVNRIGEREWSDLDAVVSDLSGCAENVLDRPAFEHLIAEGEFHGSAFFVQRSRQTLHYSTIHLLVGSPTRPLSLSPTRRRRSWQPSNEITPVDLSPVS